jgi:hypothetical protein
MRADSAVDPTKSENIRCDLATFGGCRTSRYRRAVSALALNLRTQLCDCVTNAQAMACARHADILQQLVVNLPKQINVKIVGLEGIGVLGEAD